MFYLDLFKTDYGHGQCPSISNSFAWTLKFGHEPLIEDFSLHRHRRVPDDVLWDIHPG